MFGLDVDLFEAEPIQGYRTVDSRITGAEESAFVKVHDADFLKGAKRLYMTATPRIYADSAKATDERDNITLCSMDDKELYGEQLYVLTFSNAVKQQLLVDYKVIVLAVEESHVSRRLQKLLADENNQLKVDDAGRKEKWGSGTAYCYIFPFAVIITHGAASQTRFSWCKTPCDEPWTPQGCGCPGTRQAEEATAAKLSPQQKSTELCLIRQQVEKLKASLEERRPKRGPVIDTRNAIDTVLKHLEDHGQYLWGQEIQLPAEAGCATRMVERTNNLLENFFHGMKHAERRRSGRKNLAQDFENLPAAAALAYNLNHSDYVEIICGSLDGLADAFVQLDREKHREHLSGIQSTDSAADKPIPAALRTESASLPREDRRLVRNKGMEQRINKAAKSRAPLFPVKSPSPKILCATAE